MPTQKHQLSPIDGPASGLPARPSERSRGESDDVGETETGAMPDNTTTAEAAGPPVSRTPQQEIDELDKVGFLSSHINHRLRDYVSARTGARDGRITAETLRPRSTLLQTQTSSFTMHHSTLSDFLQ